MILQTYNNYWKMDLKELPSQGKYYPKGTNIKIRLLNVQEIKYLATINADNATFILNEILEKCLDLTGVKFNDILVGDRTYLVFWLRINSFTRNSGYDINIKECSKCKKPFNTKLKLTDFDEIYATEEPSSVLLPDSNITIKLKYPTISDLNNTCEDKEIEEIAMYFDIAEKDIDILEKFINGLSALDYTILTNAISKLKIGFSKEINVYCPICGELHKYIIEFNDYGLIGSINLYEIIEMILRISKNMNYQIMDDMPWMEVELLQEAAKKISEEERQQIEKESGKISLNKQV